MTTVVSLDPIYAVFDADEQTFLRYGALGQAAAGAANGPALPLQMALSRDRGTSNQAVDQGYGLVCDVEGRILPDLIVSGANQEHGIVAHRSGHPARMLDVPVGTLLRILPNHACATAAQHERYHVLGVAGEIERVWPRFNGW